MRAHVWLSLVVVTSCSRGGDKQAGPPAADTGMADMPGMSMPTDVTLTTAQIANGRVQWAAVALGSAAPTVPGQVMPNEDRTAQLGATVPGRVMAVRVRPGDRVRRGQVLVTLQSPEAGVAQSDVAKAEAEVSARRAQAAYARSARERADRLLTLKALPRQDYDRAIADDELAAAGLAQAEAELRRAKSTAQQIGADGSASGAIAIRAPFDGVVLARMAVLGRVVEAGAPLVVVTDPTSLWLSVAAPEQLAGLFRVGGRLHFTVPAYPADTFSARIDVIGAGLDPSARTLTVRAVVSSHDERIKPQMLASVVVAGRSGVPAPLVPEDAVQFLDGRSVVFIARPDSGGGARFEPRTVQLGARAGGWVAITQGLAAGDVVVTHGALAVKAQIKKGAMPEMEM